jgi:hypothetical protein
MRTSTKPRFSSLSGCRVLSGSVPSSLRWAAFFYFGGFVLLASRL